MSPAPSTAKVVHELHTLADLADVDDRDGCGLCRPPEVVYVLRALAEDIANGHTLPPATKRWLTRARREPSAWLR